MAVPKRKTSKGKRNQRRSHHALERVNIAFDSVTGEPKLSHHISLKDGYYKGRIAVNKSNKSAVEPADASSDS